MVIKNMDSRAILAEFEPKLCARGPSYLSALFLCFLVSKMGRIIVPTQGTQVVTG